MNIKNLFDLTEKIALITGGGSQGIAARALQGNAASAEAVEMGKQAHPVAEAGWRLARQH